MPRSLLSILEIATTECRLAPSVDWQWSTVVSVTTLSKRNSVDSLYAVTVGGEILGLLLVVGSVLSKEYCHRFISANCGDVHVATGITLYMYVQIEFYITFLLYAI